MLVRKSLQICSNYSCNISFYRFAFFLDISVANTQEIGFFDPPIAWLALLCSLLLGFGDACFNTQIYSMLGGAFASNSVAAFAVFKFTQVCTICLPKNKKSKQNQQLFKIYNNFAVIFSR